ncbi:MAG: hypothetical protein ACI4TA_07270 [Acetatifactor sp.]
MTSQEITVYREIQKNADNIIKAIDTVSDKVYDDALYMQLTRQSLKCAQLYNKASEKLLEGKADYFRSGALKDIKLKTGLQYQTLLNTSTGHIADLLLRGCTNEILDMERTIKKNPDVGEECRTLAKQMKEIQENYVRRLKHYL